VACRNLLTHNKARGRVALYDIMIPSNNGFLTVFIYFIIYTFRLNAANQIEYSRKAQEPQAKAKHETRNFNA